MTQDHERLARDFFREFHSFYLQKKKNIIFVRHFYWYKFIGFINFLDQQEKNGACVGWPALNNPAYITYSNYMWTFFTKVILNIPRARLELA